VTEGGLKGWYRWMIEPTSPRRGSRQTPAMHDFSCALVIKADTFDMVNGALSVIGLGRDVLQ